MRSLRLQGLVAMFLIILILLCTAFSGGAQEWTTTRYSQINGLPQNSVNALYWDAQHMLWISTDDGLVRFDGNSFSVLKDMDRTRLLTDRFRWIIPDEHKGCMVSSSNGSVYRIHHTNMQLLIRDKSFRQIQSDKLGEDDVEWLLSKKLEPELRGRKWKDFPIRVLKMENAVWVLGKGKLIRYKKGIMQESIPVDRNTQNMFRVGGVMMLMRPTEIVKWNMQDNREEPVPFDRNQLLQSSYKWFQQPFSPYLFLVSGDSVFVVNYNRQSLHSSLLCRLPQGESVSTVSAIFYNRELNKVAIGTVSNGLFILGEVLFTHPAGSKAPQYAHNKLSDSVILGSFGHVFTQSNVSVTHSYNIKGINPQYFHVDRKGTLWAFKNDSLLKQPKGRERQSFYYPASYKIMALFASGDTVHIITPSAMISISEKSADTIFYHKTFTKENMLLSVFVKDEKIYLGSERGLYILSTSTKKLCKLSDKRNIVMLSFSGNNLIGSVLNEGLFIFTKDSICMLPKDPQNRLRKAHQLYEHKSGDVFVSTNSGLLHTQRRWIDQYLKDSTIRIPWKYYTDRDGLDNIEFNGGCTPGLVTLADGTVSMPNMGGLVWFHPDDLSAINNERPRVYLIDCSIDGQPTASYDTIRIKAGGEHLSIQAGCVYWGNPLDIHLEYYLQNYMTEFRELSSIVHPILFTQLPAGEYKLVIRCSAGITGSNSDELTLIVIKEPRFVETGWFYGIVLLLVICAVVVTIVLYNRRLVKLNKKLETKIGIRTAELQESNTNLQLTQKELLQSIDVKSKLISIIAHDIITPLRFISKVSKNFRPAMAKDEKVGNEMIDEIHDTSQRLYNNALNVLNWIRYQNNLISVKTVPVVPFVIGDEIAELFSDVAAQRNNSISNHIEMEDIIETDKTILSVIMNNLVANAVKYNRNAMIELTSRHVTGSYIITVKDNGEGINAQSLNRIHALKTGNRTRIFNDVMEGTGLGYIIIFELAELIHAFVEIETSANGTQVHISLPYSDE